MKKKKNVSFFNSGILTEKILFLILNFVMLTDFFIYIRICELLPESGVSRGNLIIAAASVQLESFAL